MKLLSLECSTESATLALMDGDVIHHQASWTAAGARHEHLTDHIAGAMSATGWKWEELTGIVVGRGPGAYSGLRASLLAAQALAAPGQLPVRAVSGMDAAALDLLARNGMDEITIVGDARRQSLWLGRCRAKTLPHEPTCWRVIRQDELPAILMPGACAASPHELVREILRNLPSSRELAVEPIVPDAILNARLASLRLAHGAPPEPLLPHYMHPAV